MDCVRFLFIPLLICILRTNVKTFIGALQVPWNSMELLMASILAHLEFHGSDRVSEIGEHQWNSMELLVSVKLAHYKFHGIPWFFLMETFVSSIRWVLTLDRIPWNLSFQILMKIVFNFVGWINVRKFISTLYLFVCLFHPLKFYYQYLHHTTCISGITHYVSKYHSKSLFNAHWNLFW